MTRRLLSLAVVSLVLLPLGCGGTRHVAVPRAAPSPGCSPARGTATMGACVPKPVGIVLGSNGKALTLHGRLIVDVSSFQGHPNWRVAHKHVAGIIAKSGEGIGSGSWTDHDYGFNRAQARRYHLFFATYYFLRQGDCAAEGDRAVKLAGPGVLIIADSEDAHLSGSCTTQFNREVRRRGHQHVSVTYTAPGTSRMSSSGGAKLWVATYGSSPGHVAHFNHGYVAWQFTDGAAGPFPHTITGLGRVDVSRDNGLLRIKH